MKPKPGLFSSWKAASEQAEGPGARGQGGTTGWARRGASPRDPQEPLTQALGPAPSSPQLFGQNDRPGLVPSREAIWQGR